jgi:hypothetical protein
MAIIKSKVKASQTLQKPVLEAKNDYKEAKQYSISDTLTANGGKSDNGSFLDISQRAKLQASNIFSDNSPYGMPSD